MAAGAVQDIIATLDCDSTNYAGKAKIKIGLSCIINVHREKEQLVPKLEQIMKCIRRRICH